MGIVWTLRVRGIAPSLGAGGSLVVAALCCLLLAAAVMTFRDWPGGGEASPQGTLTMPTPATKAAGRSAAGPSAPLTAAAAAPATGRAAGARPGRSRVARRAPGSAPVPAGTNPPGGAAPVAPVSAPRRASPQPAASPPTASQPTATQPAASAPTVPVADPRPAPRETGPVEGTVEQVRRAEEQLPLPPVVREPVQPVLDAVQEVGRTVDGATGPLLPKLP